MTYHGAPYLKTTKMTSMLQSVLVTCPSLRVPSFFRIAPPPCLDFCMVLSLFFSQRSAARCRPWLAIGRPRRGALETSSQLGRRRSKLPRKHAAAARTSHPYLLNLAERLQQRRKLGRGAAVWQVGEAEIAAASLRLFRLLGVVARALADDHDVCVSRVQKQ